jgi:hypothetical protein
MRRAHSVAEEPTFEQAQGWWSKMRRPLTFVGVPGHPHQPTVLWNTGVLFCSNPREWNEGRPRLGASYPLAPGLSEEMAGDELDALQLEFSLGDDLHVPDRLDNTQGEVAQELLEGRMPVVISRVRHAGVDWTCTVFARTAALRRPGSEDAGADSQRLLTEVRWTAHNPGRRSRPVLLSCHVTSPHIVLGYKVEMHPKAYPYARALAWEAPFLRDDRRAIRLAAVAEAGGEVTFTSRLSGDAAATAQGLGLERDVLQFRGRAAAGGSLSFRLIVPYLAIPPDEAGLLRKSLRVRFETTLSKVQQEWQRVVSVNGIETPEQIVNDCFDAYLYHAMLATARRGSASRTILKCSPNNYEGVWSAHSAIAAYSMDLRGQHELSRQVLETFLANQGPIPRHILHLFSDRQVGESEGFSAHPGFLGNVEGYMAVLWSFYHGWIMWAIGQHARLTDDWAWLRRHADRLALACEWIEAQRRRTRRRDARGRKALAYGLLPAANAFDWGFGHMFWSDAHTYRGLAEIAECLRRVRHPGAKRFLAQAQDYRQDIVTSVSRARDASPRVPLADGSTIPFVPMSVEMRDYFAPDWTYVACGPLNLAWAGVVPPDHELVEQVLAFLAAGRPLGKWDEERKKHQGWDWASRTTADDDFLEATRPKKGRCHFWRHKLTYEPGWIPQAFTFLQRDDMLALLEHLYSLVSNGGQHVALRTPVEQRDGVAWTQPGDANLLWLMRSMLVREEKGGLVLAGSCPRAWLADGQGISVHRLPTHFGLLSYRLEATARKVKGRFRFEFHARPSHIRLRLRRPSGAHPRRVTINERPLASEGEWVDVPPTARSFVAWY